MTGTEGCAGWLETLLCKVGGILCQSGSKWVFEDGLKYCYVIMNGGSDLVN